MTNEEKLVIFQTLHYLMNQVDVKGKDGRQLSVTIWDKLKELEQ